MIISGWGILLLFGTNQASTQVLVPYPPFGLATITVLILASYMMLVGIYNSARLVSVNSTLRKAIQKHTLESNLLESIDQQKWKMKFVKPSIASFTIRIF